jgi:L-lactate dehydrogenase complex protein LldF
MGRLALRLAPRWLIYNRFNLWGRQRELPVPPRESFRQWYRRERRDRAKGDSSQNGSA